MISYIMLHRVARFYKEDKMGFFKDFKRDFAQAVNELMPDKDELGAEYDDEDMVNTFDEMDNLEDVDIAPEDLLEDLDDISIDNLSIENISNSHVKEGYLETEPVNQQPSDDEDDEEMQEEKDTFQTIPNAEIISEEGKNESQNNYNSDLELFENAAETIMEPEILQAFDEAEEMDENNSEMDAEQALLEEDELKAIDSLDEENMLENIDDALALEPTEEAEPLDGMNLNQDVMEAIRKKEQEAKLQEQISSTSFDEEDGLFQEDNMAELQAKIDEKEQDINSILADDTTYITKGTTIKGDIETDGGVDIIGTVIGKVSCGGKLIIGGSIKGNVNAGEIYANAAKIEGEVNADGSVKIGVGSVVVGNVSATSAVIAGAINGDIDVHGPVIVDSTAVIMGNIKSRSVQINNGAVIEGFCSQCYSEIDVKSFFDLGDGETKLADKN